VYSPGKLIFFDPFHFKNNDESKPKFFLVLKIIDSKIILASLPSSKNHLPANQQVSHGCLEMPAICINCYIFEAKKPITKDGWSFDQNTFLYGFWLDDFSLQEFQEKYQIENVDYEIKGELTQDELSNVIKCFANSSTVKRKYKKMLIE
jgi:hypothetical protein